MDDEIVSARTFAAPRAAVFGAFRDPAVLAQWWGPAGFTNTFREFDFRPGGRWRFVMHGPDGADYANDAAFREIVPNERIVFEHLEPHHRFTMTVRYSDVAGGTRLEWRMRFLTAAEAAPLRDFIAAANEQNFDRLAAALGIPAAQ